MSTHTVILICAVIALLWLIAAIMEITWLVRGLREMKPNEPPTQNDAPITDHHFGSEHSARRQ